MAPPWRNAVALPSTVSRRRKHLFVEGGTLDSETGVDGTKSGGKAAGWWAVYSTVARADSLALETMRAPSDGMEGRDALRRPHCPYRSTTGYLPNIP